MAAGLEKWGAPALSYIEVKTWCTPTLCLSRSGGGVCVFYYCNTYQYEYLSSK